MQNQILVCCCKKRKTLAAFCWLSLFLSIQFDVFVIFGRVLYQNWTLPQNCLKTFVIFYTKLPAMTSLNRLLLNSQLFLWFGWQTSNWCWITCWMFRVDICRHFWAVRMVMGLPCLELYRFLWRKYTPISEENINDWKFVKNRVLERRAKNKVQPRLTNSKKLLYRIIKIFGFCYLKSKRKFLK